MGHPDIIRVGIGQGKADENLGVILETDIQFIAHVLMGLRDQWKKGLDVALEPSPSTR
jgi:hypothetical protein